MDDNKSLLLENSNKVKGSFVSLELSIGNQNDLISEEIMAEEDLEEIEIAEHEKLHLKKVSSLVEEAYQKVEKYSRDRIRPTPYLISSAAVSERSSCASTHYQAASLPESLDGGKAEIKDLMSLPTNFESALRMNQAMQRRFSATLLRLERTLEDNLKRQAELNEKTAEEGLLISYDKEANEAKHRYVVKASSFMSPYFKDRNGTPAPMNPDAKFKVDNGYLDLYTTKGRTWLKSEEKTLMKEIAQDWKTKLVKEWEEAYRSAQRKLNNEDLNEDEVAAIQSEVENCKDYVTFFTNVDSEKIDIPVGAEIDWDKVAAKAFDGYRTAEECQLLWNNYLHPNVNTTSWTEDEDINLQNFVSQSGSPPNWNAIAEQLKTGRSTFQVMQRYVSFTKPTLQPARWTPEDSQKLEDTVNMLRVGENIPWQQVALHFVGYTKAQIDSRWRIINPEQAKGPFTMEEDFILLKGLSKFGLNFSLIAHFLPGRRKAQVRERFKRGLLKGLTSTPWTQCEDVKIMANCSLASQHWRRMTAIFPNRDPCEIKMRFYNLHFWQSISEKKVLPPPLFPLSTTKNMHQIKMLRENIRKLDFSTNLLLDNVSDKSVYGSPMKSLEASRQAIKRKLKTNALEKLMTEKPEQPLKRNFKRIRRKNTKTQMKSWPDMALTEFFLPGRSYSGNSNTRTIGRDVSENFERIARALQLNLRHPASYEELTRFSILNYTEEDFDLINESFAEEEPPKTYFDGIPTFPPNESTLGAFRSLLLHKPKLKEMASKEFLLFKVRRDQLNKLGNQINTMNKEKKNKNELIEETVRNILDPDQKDYEKSSTSKVGSRRKAAQTADLVNSVFLQNKVLKESIKLKKSAIVNTIEIPSRAELNDMFTASELPNLHHGIEGICRTNGLLEQEDNLLFQRFLGIFFWPSLFMLQPPSNESYDIAENLVKDLKFKMMDTRGLMFDPFDEMKGRGKLPHLDIDTQEKLIANMENLRKIPLQIRRRMTMKIKHPSDVGRPTLPDLPIGGIIKKKSITKLKRSLIMKKVWESRRKGEMPPTTSRTKARVAPKSKRPRRVKLEREKNEEDP